MKKTALDVANMESACDFSSDCDFTDVMNDVIDIRRAVASLSSDERELISLIFTHGMSYSEVSLVMGMPVGTVKANVVHQDKIAENTWRCIMDRIECTEAVELMPLYYAKSLSSADTGRLMIHISECADCRADCIYIPPFQICPVA